MHTLLGPNRRVSIAIALAAIAAAIAIASPTALAGDSGGIGPSSGSSDQGARSDDGNKNMTPPRYAELWDRVSAADRRWAHRVSMCESGRDPNAVALGGDYRGAFMFTWDAWKTSPKSPGGDPIDYSYVTQAVVAVALKARDGTGPWPVCG